MPIARSQSSPAALAVRVCRFCFRFFLCIALPLCGIAAIRALRLQAQQTAPPSTDSSASAVSGARIGPALDEGPIRRLLVGKDLYLRSGWLDNALAFDERGALVGHSPQGSYTLCLIRIDKVRLTKRKLELEGRRYGLHFLGAAPGEDLAQAVDRVDITPKKKPVRIAITREPVKKPKRQKHAKKFRPEDHPSLPAVQAESAAVPPQKGTNMARTQAQADRLLLAAINHVFAQGLDARMTASLPEFWKPYYETDAAKAASWPDDPGVMRQRAVDQKARILAIAQPASNQFAQDYGVAGMAEYRVVVGVDGKPLRIAVERPIGFGLDENAVAVIGKAVFAPAVKDGKAVASVLDLAVVFRIYSKRTDFATAPAAENAPAPRLLPGPYSVEH